MTDHHIDFQAMEWKSPVPGVRQKVFTKDDQRIRIVEFSEDFIEEDWCKKGHVGYVLEGGLSIDFDGEVLEFIQGDGIFIPKGEESKHKAIIAKGKKALLILFEEIE